MGADVVEKTVLKRNQQKESVNRPLHVGTSFVVLYVGRYKSAKVKSYIASIH